MEPMTNTNTTITAQAFFHCTYSYETKSHTLFPESPMRVEIRSEHFDTEGQAEAVLASFPKSTRGRVIRVYSTDKPVRYSARWVVELAANGSNGGINETGVKRFRSVMRNAGDDFTFERTNSVNSYETLDQFLAAIA